MQISNVFPKLAVTGESEEVSDVEEAPVAHTLTLTGNAFFTCKLFQEVEGVLLSSNFHFNLWVCSTSSTVITQQGRNKTVVLVQLPFKTRECKQDSPLPVSS